MLNKKKLLACVCTGAMALSLSIPAFAADMTNPTETTFNGAAAPATVSVSVKAPDTPQLYVNPYGMSYSPADMQIKAGASLAAGDIVIKETPTSAGFFSDTALIQNNSKSAFGVKVAMKADATGSAVAVAAAAPGTPGDNTLVGNFEIADAAAVTGTVNNVAGVVTVTPDWNGTNKKTVAIPTAAKGAASTAAPASDTSYTLRAATETTDSITNVTTITPTYAAFRLTGNAYVGSTGTWADTDVVNVTVAFTFTPGT